MDGEIATTLPNKEEYIVESVVCDKENTGIWDEENWKVKVENPTDKEITCTVTFDYDEFKKLVKTINSNATNMSEVLANATDVDNMVTNKEAMEIIVSSDNLKQAIKENENYTDTIKKQFLNSTVISETEKYNAGLPCYILGVNGDILGGCTNKFSWANIPSCAGFSNWNAYACGLGSYYVYTSVNQINVDDYDYLELSHSHTGNSTSSTGTTTIGLYTNTANDTNFTVSKSETWNANMHPNALDSKLILSIGDLKGNFYLKGITRNNGQGSNRTFTAIDIWNKVALY